MLPTLRSAVDALWITTQAEQTWCVLEEQLLHSRIADLVLLRLDVDLLEGRLAGGWDRPLRLPEIRVLRALRQQRPASPSAVADATRLRETTVVGALRTLERDHFVERTATGTYVRLAPSGSLAERVVSFEAKRDDAKRALEQARGHLAWADETYVAFDRAYAARFEVPRPAYARVGIGLLSLSPGQWRVELRARPRRRRSGLEAAVVGERALGRLLDHPRHDRPERRLPHGGGLSKESEPHLAGQRAGEVRALRRKYRKP